jgi:hypothetical protein
VAKNALLMKAAIAGIIGASAIGISAHAVEGAAAAKGHCIGGNACKGKSACATSTGNSCSGQNGCKGKGMIETTKAECEKMAKKNKDIKFEETVTK